MKRVNWEKLHGLEGTIWSEVSILSSLCSILTLVSHQMSGLHESLEYSQLETQFTTASAHKLKQGKI